MTKITREQTQTGGRSAAASKAEKLSITVRFYTPHTKRTLQRNGNYLVEFPPDWQKINGRKGGEETLASAESGAPRFKLGDHSLDLDVIGRLNALPGHRHVAK